MGGGGGVGCRMFVEVGGFNVPNIWPGSDGGGGE